MLVYQDHETYWEVHPRESPELWEIFPSGNSTKETRFEEIRDLIILAFCVIVGGIFFICAVLGFFVLLGELFG